MNQVRISWLLLAIALAVEAWADNWPQWRGEGNRGSSPTADPPVHWGVDQNIRWRVKVPGKGSSTPIIWRDSVYVLTAIATDRRPPAGDAIEDTAVATNPFGTGPKPDCFYQFAVLSYDRRSGEERWRRVVTEEVPHEAGHLTNTFASSSPVTDGRHLFVSFGSRGVYCLDLAGNPVWQQDLGRMETRRDFGEAASPALHKNRLVVPWDHEGQSFLTALDATTGEVIWKTERDEPTTWATPLIVEHAGKTQVVTNGITVRSYDLETGKLIWSCGGQAFNPIPCPISHDGMVFCMTGYRGNAVYAISLDAVGDVSESEHVIWSRNDTGPYVASAVLDAGRIYLTKSRTSIVSVLDAATGRAINRPTPSERNEHTLCVSGRGGGASLFQQPRWNDGRVGCQGRSPSACDQRVGGNNRRLAGRGRSTDLHPRSETSVLHRRTRLIGAGSPASLPFARPLRGTPGADQVLREVDPVCRRRKPGCPAASCLQAENLVSAAHYLRHTWQ